jgi:hypothetical protein
LEQVLPGETTTPDTAAPAMRRIDGSQTCLLFLLIGTIIGLSNLSEESIARLRRQLIVRRWRGIVRGRRKI